MFRDIPRGPPNSWVLSSGSAVVVFLLVFASLLEPLLLAVFPSPRIVAPMTALGPPHPDVARCAGVGSVGRNERRNEENENEPRCSSCFIFVTHYMGLPLPGSPLMYLRPPFLHRASLSRPDPSGKGRGRCSGTCVPECAEALEFEPTSLKRGEGLVFGLFVVCGWR